MSDTIYRDDAVRAVCKGCLKENPHCRHHWDCPMLTNLGKLPSADRLIPCLERLPKIGEHHISEPCLVYCKCGAYAFAELEENIFGQVGWSCERDDDYHEPIGEVVAWMPLPEPWRGADND